MKKIIYCILFILMIISCASCSIFDNVDKSGTYYLDKEKTYSYRSRFYIDSKTVEDCYFILKKIDENTYFNSHCINTIQSDGYYSIDLYLKFSDQEMRKYDIVHYSTDNHGTTKSIRNLVTYQIDGENYYFCLNISVDSTKIEYIYLISNNNLESVEIYNFIGEGSQNLYFIKGDNE